MNPTKAEAVRRISRRDFIRSSAAFTAVAFGVPTIVPSSVLGRNAPSNRIALAIILVVAGLTILSTFINIAPLLASVSIVGLAISFGAQTLVKDMISGTFLLFEGQFGIGDVVK